MRNHNFKKNFGQNFLNGTKFAHKLIDPLNLTKEDTLLEIGPGDGSVTKIALLKGCKVISIEVDYDLLADLLRKFNNFQNFNLEHSDILNVNFLELLNKYSSNKSVKVIGSLPYNISKKIIKKITDFNLEEKEYKFQTCSFIIQEEVAKDYISKVPQASFLSNYIQLFWEIRKLESIPASQFFPKPKVNGAILFLKYKEDINKSYIELIKLIKIGYSSPRKTLVNNLKNSKKWDVGKIQIALTKVNLNTKVRAMELQMNQWENLLSNLNST